MYYDMYYVRYMTILFLLYLLSQKGNVMLVSYEYINILILTYLYKKGLVPARIERATFALLARRSNQLSYETY